MGEVRYCGLSALASFTYQLGSELIICESLTKEVSLSAIPDVIDGNAKREMEFDKGLQNGRQQ